MRLHREQLNYILYTCTGVMLAAARYRYSRMILRFYRYLVHIVLLLHSSAKVLQ